MTGNPQLENGYSKIANELLDALCHFRLGGEQRQIFDYIMRMSYGWNDKKSKEPITFTQFEDATGLKRPSVNRAIKALLEKNLIGSESKGKSKIYWINKRYKTWIPTDKKTTGNQFVTSNQLVTIDSNQLVTDTSNQIVTDSKIIPINIKESIKESIKEKNVATPKKRSATPSFQTDSIPYLLSQTLFSQILFNIPEYGPNRNGKREPTIQRWASDIDKMIRIDNRLPCAIWNMILFVQDTENSVGEFWHKNIMSGSKLRKQYDQLALNIKAELRKAERNKPQHEKLLEVGKKWIEKKMAETQSSSQDS